MAMKRNALSLVSGSSNARTAKKPGLAVGASAAEIRPVDSPPAPSEPVFLRDSYASTAFAELIDRSSHAAMARFTAGLSPMTLIGAYADWAHTSLRCQESACNSSRRRCGSGCGSRTTRHAALWNVTHARHALSRYRRINASSRKDGARRRTISFISPFCSISNGGTTL